MALTAAQRRRLPRSAYAFAPRGAPRSRWRYPMPTRAQARRAGISEGQRRRTINSAKAYSAHRNTLGSPARIQPVARRRRGAAPAPRRGRRAVPYRRYRGAASRGRVTRARSGFKTIRRGGAGARTSRARRR
jgi:hypothetical protein